MRVLEQGYLEIETTVQRFTQTTILRMNHLFDSVCNNRDRMGKQKDLTVGI